MVISPVLKRAWRVPTYTFHRINIFTYCLYFLLSKELHSVAPLIRVILHYFSYTQCKICGCFASVTDCCMVCFLVLYFSSLFQCCFTACQAINVNMSAYALVHQLIHYRRHLTVLKTHQNGGVHPRPSGVITIFATSQVSWDSLPAVANLYIVKEHYQWG